MKKLLFLLIACIWLSICLRPNVNAQGVGINASGNAANNSAGLDVDFTNKGFLPPRMTTAQRDAITNPAEGLVIYNITTNCLNMRIANLWKQLCGECDFAGPAAASNSPVCAGNTINLSAANIPGASYLWVGPSGFVSTLQNPSISNATASLAGGYVLSASLNGCTSAVSFAAVTVYPTPSSEFTFPSSAPTFQSVTFNATTTSGVIYSWSFPSGSPSGSTVQSPSVSWSSSGTYTVSLTVSDNGCSSTTTHTINITSPGSCAAIKLNNPSATDGSYTIDPGNGPLEAYCDMTTDGGGWTLMASAIGGIPPVSTWTATTGINVANAFNPNTTFRLSDATINLLRNNGNAKLRVTKSVGVTVYSMAANVYDSNADSRPSNTVCTDLNLTQNCYTPQFDFNTGCWGVYNDWGDSRTALICGHNVCNGNPGVTNNLCDVWNWNTQTNWVKYWLK